jgi:hypothetical protein
MTVTLREGRKEDPPFFLSNSSMQMRQLLLSFLFPNQKQVHVVYCTPRDSEAEDQNRIVSNTFAKADSLEPQGLKSLLIHIRCAYYAHWHR